MGEIDRRMGGVQPQIAVGALRQPVAQRRVQPLEANAGRANTVSACLPRWRSTCCCATRSVSNASCT